MFAAVIGEDEGTLMGAWKSQLQLARNLHLGSPNIKA